jgi:hypothetical protein
MMSERLKTILIMLSLVAIGFLAGFLTHRNMVSHKIQRVAELKSASGFEQQLMGEMKLDGSQQEQVGPIITKYAEKISRASQEGRLLRRMMIDSMHAEIKPFLQPDQIEQLNRFSLRFRTYQKSWHAHRDSIPR